MLTSIRVITRSWNLTLETNLRYQAYICFNSSAEILNSFFKTNMVTYLQLLRTDFYFIAYHRSVSYSVVEDYWNPHQLTKLL